MTRTERPAQAINFALLASGADFSCRVFDALRRRRCLPQQVVLPQYPPAEASVADGPLRVMPPAESEFLSMLGELPRGYAPATDQAQMARRLRRDSIEYILVACWPWLIGCELIESASKAALNLHPSLLPAFRGANPVEQQIAAGRSSFGVSLHLLDPHFDRGDIVAQREFDLPPASVDKAGVEAECAELGVALFIDAAASFERGWRTVAQPPREPAAD